MAEALDPFAALPAIGLYFSTSVSGQLTNKSRLSKHTLQLLPHGI